LPTVAFFATLFHRIQTQTSGVEVNFRAITLLLAIFLAFAQPAAARTARGALGGAAGGALIGGLAGGGRGAAIAVASALSRYQRSSAGANQPSLLLNLSMN
jgi:hypothetical protein